jgi:hypothetical protein
MCQGKWKKYSTILREKGLLLVDWSASLQFEGDKKRDNIMPWTTIGVINSALRRF